MKGKIKIKQFCPLPPPYGGITVYVKRLSDKLVEDGFVVGGYYTSQCRDSKILNSKFYQPLDYSYTKNPVIRLCRTIFRNVKLLKQFLPYKLIHYHGLENLQLLAVAHFLLNKEIVVMVHSSMVESFYRRTSIINRFAMKLLATHNVQWVACSSQSKDCLKRLPFTFKREIAVIPAYVPYIETSKKTLPENMTQYIKCHKKIISFYAHSFMLNDGVDVYGFEQALVMYSKLIEHNNSIGMVICISDVSDSMKLQNLRQKAVELGIDSRIYWQLGAIDNIHTLWDCTDVYIRPTSTDGDSVAVREIIDHGVPVVASDVCPRPSEVITYQYNIIDDLYGKVLEALDKSKKKVSPNYKPYNDMKEIYKSLVSK